MKQRRSSHLHGAFQTEKSSVQECARRHAKRRKKHFSTTARSSQFVVAEVVFFFFLPSLSSPRPGSQGAKPAPTPTAALRYPLRAREEEQSGSRRGKQEEGKEKGQWQRSRRRRWRAAEKKVLSLSPKTLTVPCLARPPRRDRGRACHASSGATAKRKAE